MADDQMDLAAFTSRLARLERRMRAWQAVAIGALLLAALGAISARSQQGRPDRPAPEVIKAHEFDVVDKAGQVRIRLSASSLSARVEVLDAHGERAAAMEVVRIGKDLLSTVAVGRDGGDGAMLTSSQQSAEVGVGYSPDFGAAIAGKSAASAVAAANSLLAQQGSEPSVGMSISRAGEATINIQDAQGFSMDLGTAATVTPPTGETHKTSAASILMFGNDKDHKVIWQAPNL